MRNRDLRGLAMLGLMFALIGTAAGLMMAFGYRSDDVAGRTPPPHPSAYLKTEGIVVKAACRPMGGGIWSGDLTVRYTVDSRSYVTTSNCTNSPGTTTPPTVGAHASVWYEAAFPGDALTFDPIKPTHPGASWQPGLLAGWVIAGISFLVGVACFWLLYLKKVVTRPARTVIPHGVTISKLDELFSSKKKVGTRTHYAVTYPTKKPGGPYRAKVVYAQIGNPNGSTTTRITLTPTPDGKGVDLVTRDVVGNLYADILRACMWLMILFTCLELLFLAAGDPPGGVKHAVVGIAVMPIMGLLFFVISGALGKASDASQAVHTAELLAAVWSAARKEHPNLAQDA